MYPDVHGRAHRRTVQVLQERLPDGALVLDVGAGGGELTRSLRVAGFRAVAVDPAATGPRGELAVRGTWGSLPVRAGTCHAVVACASLHYAERVRVAIGEVARALGPEGLFIIALSPVHPTREGAKVAQETARERTGIADYSHLVEDDLLADLAAAGFTTTREASPLPPLLSAKRKVKRWIGIEQARFPTFICTWREEQGGTDGDR